MDIGIVFLSFSLNSEANASEFKENERHTKERNECIFITEMLLTHQMGGGYCTR